MKTQEIGYKLFGMLATTFAMSTLPCLVLAQDLEEQKEEAEVAMIEEVMVTGVAKPTTKFESSASVSSLSSEEMSNYAPRSTAEIFRNIPGIQAEASAGDANANIKVRGMPISSGGSRYVSLQEDGFPTLLIGDVAFATADSWLRADTTISSVQSIRGGTASTQAFNSPGGIINFISKDGSVAGGGVALTAGLDYDSIRLDADYGNSINDNWSYHVGGFIRKGEGPREAPTDIEEGYQVKATLAGQFERGSLKVHFKHLDDNVPTYLPIGAQYEGGTKFKQFGSVSLTNGTLYNNTNDCAPRRNNDIQCNKDGFAAKMTSLALVGDFDISERFTLGARYRNASIDGNFASPFITTPYDDPAAGPSQEIIYFDTESNNMDNSFAELKITGDFDVFSAIAGVVYSSQDISTVWNFNQYYVRLDKGLTPFDSGNSVDGVLYGNPAFGNCCTRSYDYDVDATAPYIALNGDIGDRFVWDASYRQNDYKIKGMYAENPVLMPLDVNGDGQIGQNEQDVPTIGAESSAKYKQDFGSWSIGGNYALNDSVALFANFSEGGSIAAPDRVTGNLNPDGTMDNGAGYATVRQAEVGVKWQFDKGYLYTTYFDAKTDEERAFEVTTQEFLQNSYKSHGLEFEGLFDFGNGFRIQGSLTLTDAEIVDTANGQNIGNKPRRQADYIFNITPSYTADRWDVGLNFLGTDDVYIQDNNDLKFGGYQLTNLFANYYFTENLSISLNANNVFDEEAFTEGEEGSAMPGDLVRIRPINGRTTSLTLRYQFF